MLAPELRAAVIAVYDGKCQYCGAVGANHIDHISARAHGGSDELVVKI
jgi:5-methylcytosine-specific restriction endonuclease McrA